ncbi:MAG: hypothetical protein ABIP48_32325 [Planctomycetota bacterium]
MSAKKRKASSRRKSPRPSPQFEHWVLLFQGRGRAVTLIALSVVAFFGLWHAAWQEVGRGVLASEQYQITREKVEIPPPPEWVHRDIRAEVFRDASLDGPLSLLDEDLVQRIANAFSLHPWVAEVRRVAKHFPARVEVELEYRRPVLMVPVLGGVRPVDAEGVLLPTSDFSPIEAGRYPRLAGVETDPIGLEGTPWGDIRVHESAEIAAALGPAWQQLKLDYIIPATLVELGHGNEYTYELVTKGGSRILWGRAPSAEIPEEARAVDKVTRLVKYQEENGTLEGRDGPQRLDVRTPGSVRNTSRTAGKLNRALD